MRLGKILVAIMLASPAYAANWTLNAPMTCSGAVCALDTSVNPPATDYQLQLPFSCNSSTCSPGSWAIQLPGTAPVFTTQPAAQTVNAGAAATFTDAVTGSPTPTCQWQKLAAGGTTWTNISGATACGSYTTPATVTGDNTSQFRNVATNSVGSVNSAAATLNVTSTCVTVLPGSGSVTDGSGHVWTIDGNGNVKEDNVAVNNGAGTAQLTYIADNIDGVTGGNSIYAKDASGSGWYEWVPGNNNWTSIGQTLPSCAPSGSFTLGGYTFGTPSFDDEFTSLSDIGGAAQTTADSNHKVYANGATYGLTGICCMIYEGPDSSLYNPFSILSPNGLEIKIHQTNASGANGWRSGAIQTLAPNGAGFKQQYGYFEASIKNPAYSSGTMGPSFPSFWMLTAPGASNPTDETDVYEIYGGCSNTPGAYNHNITSTLYWQHNPDGSNSNITLDAGVDLSADYHEYGFLWDANNVSMYLDRKLIKTAPTPSFLNKANGGSPLYMIIDLDGYIDGGCSTGGASLMEGAKLDIQYLKAWSLPQ